MFQSIVFSVVRCVFCVAVSSNDPLVQRVKLLAWLQLFVFCVIMSCSNSGLVFHVVDLAAIDCVVLCQCIMPVCYASVVCQTVMLEFYASVSCLR